MGKDADELLTSIGMPNEERTTFDSVVNKFEDYFSTKKNIFYHRAIFLQRIQGSEEKIDPYINDLHKMSERCEWICNNCKSRSFNDEMILLKLVTSIKDKSLSKHLQLQEGLTLHKAVHTVRQAEALDEQRNHLQDFTDSTVMEAMLRESSIQVDSQGEEIQPENYQHLLIPDEDAVVVVPASSTLKKGVLRVTRYVLNVV